jgi:hypothetical protein
MNESNEQPNGTTPHPLTDPPSGVPVPEVKPPSREGRRGLAWALQNEALRRSDPLRANLGVLAGDLMLLAHQIGGALEENPPAAMNSPERFRQFNQKADLYLKVVREMSRLVQADQQIARADRPAQEE